MVKRMHKGKLFEECSRDDDTVSGYRLDSENGKRIGPMVVVPARDVELTGNDQFCLEVSTMNEAGLFDLVMDYPEYLTDHYYFYPLGKAICDRYDQLKAQRNTQ